MIPTDSISDAFENDALESGKVDVEMIHMPLMHSPPRGDKDMLVKWIEHAARCSKPRVGEFKR